MAFFVALREKKMRMSTWRKYTNFYRIEPLGLVLLEFILDPRPGLVKCEENISSRMM
jgi:hypothetical protein